MVACHPPHHCNLHFRNLVDAGLTCKLLMKIAKEWDEQLRDEWKENIRSMFSSTGNEFIFVEETSKNDHDTGRRYGRALVGERAEFTDVFVQGDRYSVAAALTTAG